MQVLKRELKSDLEWIILQAMEKDQTRRYDATNRLAQELEPYLRDKPVLAHPPSDVPKTLLHIAFLTPPVQIAHILPAASGHVGSVQCLSLGRRSCTRRPVIR